MHPIDPASLPKHFDSKEVEARLDAAWEREGVYHWDPSRPRSETLVVDTPPPTVSGSLHVGHVFSFTQPDPITATPKPIEDGTVEVVALTLKPTAPGSGTDR
jgi:hypothetical protein